MLRDLLSRWGNWVLYSPTLLLLLAILSAVGALHYTSTHLSIDTDTGELIAPDAPFQQNRRKFEKAFGQEMHTLLVIVESDVPELTKATAKRLGRLLSSDNQHFTKVYRPDDNAFFQNNGLLYLDLDDLENLSQTLAEAQPFIGRISQDPSLSGFFSIFEDAFNAKSEDVPIDMDILVTKVAQTLRDSLDGKPALLSWEKTIAENRLTSELSGKAFLFVTPVLDFSQIRPAEQAIDAIRRAIIQVQTPHFPKVNISITGEVGLEDDELNGMSQGTFTASLFSIVLVLFILLLAYRSPLLVFATLITLALGMIFSGLFAAASVKELNLISVAFAVSNIGLGVEYAIHFCLRYRDNILQYPNREAAIRAALLGISPSLLLCALTTSIGLYAFIPTEYKGISELGLLAGTSLFICLFVTLTVLPVLLKILPTPSVRKPEHVQKNKHAQTFSALLAHFTLHYAKPITLVTAVAAVAALVLAFHVQTDFNPLNLRDPKTESVIAFKALMNSKETSPMTLTILAENADKTHALQKQLKQLDTVDKTVSLFDYVPADQAQKLALIEEMTTVLGTQQQGFPPLKEGGDPVPAVKRLISAIDFAITQKTKPEEIAHLQDFKQELNDFLIETDARLQPERRFLIENIQTTLIGTLPGVMKALLSSFNAQEITLDAIPAEVRERWLSKEGVYRIQVFPKYDLNELANLEKFITDVQAIAPDATDLPVMYFESMKAVIGAFQQAIMIALVFIACLLYFIRRCIVDTLLVMAPLVLAGLFTMATTVLTGTPINFANVIALPLLLGLGVDNGIHMVEKLHHSQQEDQDIYQSSTARGIFYGALTTISSFAGLAFSPHQGIASMGLVITIGIFWIMLCTFVILPALSCWVFRHQR